MHLRLYHGKSRYDVRVPIFVVQQFWMNQHYFVLHIVLPEACLPLVKPLEQVQHKDQMVVRYEF